MTSHLGRMGAVSNACPLHALRTSDDIIVEHGAIQRSPQAPFERQQLYFISSWSPSNFAYGVDWLDHLFQTADQQIGGFTWHVHRLDSRLESTSVFHSAKYHSILEASLRGYDSDIRR